MFFHGRLNFIQSFLILLFLVGTSNGMEEDKSYLIPSWMRIKEIEDADGITVAQFDRTSSRAIVGFKNGPALLLGLRKKRGLTTQFIERAKDIVSASFNPVGYGNTFEIAVATKNKVKLLTFEDNGGSEYEWLLQTTIFKQHDSEAFNHGSLKWVGYNDNGYLIAFVNNNMISVWNRGKAVIAYQHLMNKFIYTAQFLPRAYPGDQLIVGQHDGVSTTCFYAYNISVPWPGFNECKICYDRNLDEIVLSLSFAGDTIKLSKKHDSSCTYFRDCTSSEKVSMNDNDREVLIIERTDSETMISDLREKKIAILPKDPSIVEAKRSFDGEYLLTLLAGKKKVQFWQQKAEE